MSERLLDGTVSFGEKLATSQVFAALFRDGMALVEETAAYLDGPGRQDSSASSAAVRLLMRPKACGSPHA